MRFAFTVSQSKPFIGRFRIISRSPDDVETSAFDLLDQFLESNTSVSDSNNRVIIGVSWSHFTKVNFGISGHHIGTIFGTTRIDNIPDISGHALKILLDVPLQFASTS